jgi:hypothetical protein
MSRVGDLDENSFAVGEDGFDFGEDGFKNGPADTKPSRLISCEESCLTRVTRGLGEEGNEEIPRRASTSSKSWLPSSL